MLPPRAIPVLILLLVGLASAGSNTTQSGNLTAINVSMPQASSWHAVVGAASPAPPVPLTINATPGDISSLTIATGSGSFPFGVNGSIFLLFSNSSTNITSLSPGNLALLDQSMGPFNDNATATFTYTTTFVMPNFTVSGVPTAYTNAPNGTAFRMGYMQDQDGNIVIAVQLVNHTTGYNGSLFDFQFMLPAQNGTAVPYYLTVLIKGKARPTPHPPIPPSHIVIAPNVTVEVLPQPPNITLPPSNGALLVYPILKEMSPGDNALLFPLLENRGQGAVYVDAVPSGSSAALVSAVTGVLLPPDKPTSLVIPVQVPWNVPAGYYALSIEYSLNGSANISQPLIIHVVPPQAGLTVYREISIDQQNNNSVMRLSAVNKGASSIGLAAVFEQIPSAFDLEGISFTIPPTVTNKSRIRWDLMNLVSNETRTLSYVLSGIPTNLELFTLWPSAQTTVLEPVVYRSILLEGFDVPDIGPGERGDYVLKLFNAGSTDETVAVRITGAAGWQLEPDSFNVSIPAGATSDLAFSMTAPVDASDPVYTFTVHLDYAGITDQKTLLVPLNHEKLVTTAPSISQQLISWAVGNAYLLVLAVLAGVAVALALRWGYFELRKPRYDKKRVDDLMKLQDMLGDDKNKK